MSFKKGCIPWNKDLTKETDERVMAISKKFRGRKIGGAIKHICWNKGLTKETDERLKAVGKKISKKLKGVPKGK